jgi:hypothetical protein
MSAATKKRTTPRTSAGSVFTRVRRLGMKLPDVEEGTSWGFPALKVDGKMFAVIPTHRSAEPESIAVRLSFVERDLRLEADPDTYYVKPHYVNYPCVLARVRKLNDAALADLLETGWQFVRSPKKRSKTAPKAAPKTSSKPR